MSTKKPSSIRIYYKNINGICTYNSWNIWGDACESSKEKYIDIIGLNETNINWNESI
jgi:hypothetical protein